MTSRFLLTWGWFGTHYCRLFPHLPRSVSWAITFVCHFKLTQNGKWQAEKEFCWLVLYGNMFEPYHHGDLLGTCKNNLAGGRSFIAINHGWERTPVCTDFLRQTPSLEMVHRLTLFVDLIQHRLYFFSFWNHAFNLNWYIGHSVDGTPRSK